MEIKYYLEICENFLINSYGEMFTTHKDFKVITNIELYQNNDSIFNIEENVRYDEEFNVFDESQDLEDVVPYFCRYKEITKEEYLSYFNTLIEYNKFLKF